MFINSLGLIFFLIVAWVLLILSGIDIEFIWAFVVSIAALCWWWLFDRHRIKLEKFMANPAKENIETIAGVWHDLAVTIDKMEREKNKSIQKKEQQLQEFFEAIQAFPHGVMLLDAQGKIQWCNRMMTQHTGIDEKKDIEQYVQNMIRHPLFLDYFRSKNFTSEIVIPSPAHMMSPHAIDNIAIRIYIIDEAQQRMLLITSDISSIQKAQAMRSDFVANVSHEIRTPLTVIKGFIETLQTLTLSFEEQQHYLQLMAQQTSRMEAVVADLLTLSKLEAMPSPDWEHWCDIASLLQEVVADARSLAQIVHADQAQTIEVQCELQEAGIQIAADAQELKSALMNLLANAVLYSTPLEKIMLSCRLLASGELEYLIEDKGPGIAQEHLPRLTERFYRVDRSRSRQTGGTGLGLAIVKHVTQRLGGDLYIESEIGKGSRFTIRIPSQRIRTAS